ncbi:MAG TPA: two-component regulator propeller domain-containing protein [Acidobacteriota bacterium]|nr:two-component regulator propeller domain-containing protein [Acidobacteriota bacterium]
MRTVFRGGIRIRWALTALMAVIGLCVSGPVWALDPTKAVTEYTHDVWQAELPQSSVLNLLQSQDGYLWFGTWEGLVRFDGVEFTVFSSRNTEQMRTNGVSALYQSRDGALWFGLFGSGLVRLQNGQFTPFSKQDGLAGNIIRTIIQDRQGTLWVGTEQGLSCLEPTGRFRTFTAQDRMPLSPIQALAEDGVGGLWIGARDGLYRFQSGTVTRLTTADGLLDNSIRALLVDRGGRLWVGTAGGLQSFSGGKWASFTVRNGLSFGTVLKIIEDRHGTLWIGTEGGLSRFVSGRFSVLTVRDGFVNESVQALCEDHEGSLWIGTNWGLSRLRDATFVTYTRQQGLAGNVARTVIEDRTGKMWIGTDGGGLSCLDYGTVTNYGLEQGLPSMLVKSLCEDRQGQLWIGTSGGGLARMTSGGQFTVVTTRDGLANNHIRAIFEDQTGRLWVGTESGLSCLEGGRWRTYTTRDGLSNDFICSFAEDSTGTVWIGTLNGLNRFRDGQFTRFDTEQGLSDNAILTLYPDQEGNLWIGTSDGGLNRFRDGTFRAYRSRDGMADNKVFQILEDETRTLWMSSNQGVYGVRKSDLDAFDQGHLQTLTCVLFDQADGLKSRQCSGSCQPAAWKSRDGRLWFATADGVSVFHPARVTHNLLPPPVTIHRVVVDGASLSAEQQAVFASGKEKFEFHYTGLSFIAPTKMRFKYRLEGFDTTWNEVGARRTAYYTNLPPGNYAFQVLACNNTGVWSPTGAVFRFELLRPWWQTWWANLMIIGGIVGIGFGAYSYQIQQLKKKQNQRLARVRHLQKQYLDAVGQLLESIQVINSQHALATVLQTIAEESARLIGGLPGGIGFVEDRQVVFRRIWLDSWQDVAYRVPFEFGTAGRVAATGTPAIVNEIKDEPHIAFREILESHRIVGLLQVPIITRQGTVVGVLMVRRPAERAPFTQTDCRLIELLANQAAVAIENARLYGELEVKRDELEEKNLMISESLRELERLYQNEQNVSQTLQQLNQMKINFMIVTSHEMRTPLAVLKGYLDVLADEFLGPLTEEQRDSLVMCQDMINRMIGNFEGILEMIKINAGQFTLERNECDVCDLILELLNDLSGFLKKRRQILALDLPESVILRADREKLRMALVHLLQNAIKFSPDGAQIQLRVTCLNEQVHFEIRDSGIGIAPAELERIFEFFYTGADPATHSSGKYEFSARGNGLGLSIARSYVAAHGGRLWAESDGPGKGSCFHLELPLAEPQVTVGSENKTLSKLDETVHNSPSCP